MRTTLMRERRLGLAPVTRSYVCGGYKKTFHSRSDVDPIVVCVPTKASSIGDVAEGSQGQGSSQPSAGRLSPFILLWARKQVPERE